MKAAVLVSPGKFEIREMPVPETGKGGILVRLKACGICTLEQRLYSGRMKLPLPVIPGHEASGIIEYVDPAVSADFRPGQRVALDLVYRCGECYYCRIGKSNLCANRFGGGMKMLGGFAEYIAVKPSQVFLLPDTLDFLEAAFAEPLACCIHSLKRMKVAMTEDILIAGAGVMGLLHLLAARCMGLRTTLSDPDPARRETARSLGADFVIDPAAVDAAAFGREITGGLGFSSCVVTSPAPEALASSLGALAKAARLNIYTAYDDFTALPVDANAVHRQEILITGAEGRLAEDFFQATRLLSFRKVNVRPLVSATCSFSTLDKGFALAASGRAFRVLLDHEAP